MFDLIAEILDDLVVNSAITPHKKIEIQKKVGRLRKANNKMIEDLNKIKTN